MKQFLWKNSFLLHLQLTGHNFLFSHFIQIIFDSRAKVAHSSCLFLCATYEKNKNSFFFVFVTALTLIKKNDFSCLFVCFVFGKVFTSYWHFSWTSNFFLHTFSKKTLMLQTKFYSSIIMTMWSDGRKFVSKFFFLKL